jgi:lysine/ornithine N-monooxygenase
VGLLLDREKIRDYKPTAQYDVVVLGAGPYGLSAASHLLGKELKVAVFGKPLHFWRQHMPEGMLLRSYWWASSLSDPMQRYSFERYFRTMGLQGYDPLPIETFIDYGLWFQRNAVPNLDETLIVRIEREGGCFILTLEDGRMIQSKAVVMAPGLHYYLYYPVNYVHLPSSLVSHSAEHHRMDTFTGRRVAVIGGGQGALETAALLHEQGTEVRIISRRPIRWIPTTNTNVPALLRELRAPRAGMGNGWLNLLLEKYPYTFQRWPRNMKDYILTTRHGPAAAAWLRSRIINKIPVYEGKNVTCVEELNGRVKLNLADGRVLDVDHLVLGTGYRADVQRLTMLSPSLREVMQTYQRAPILNAYFESSVAGLYFLGFSAAHSFGPFYRFVIGCDAAARRVTSAVSRLVLAR